MPVHESRDFRYLLIFALLSFFAYILLEMAAQYALPATYNARFSDLALHEAAKVEAEVQKLNDRRGSVNLRISRDESPIAEGQVDLDVSMDLTERGFSTLASFVSNIEPSGRSRNLTFSRQPNPLGQKLALLGSILLFLLLLKGLIAPRVKADRR